MGFMRYFGSTLKLIQLLKLFRLRSFFFSKNSYHSYQNLPQNYKPKKEQIDNEKSPESYCTFLAENCFKIHIFIIIFRCFIHQFYYWGTSFNNTCTIAFCEPTFCLQPSHLAKYNDDTKVKHPQQEFYTIFFYLRQYWKFL